MIGKFIVGVAIIIEQNGHLLIGKRSFEKFGAGLWEFPSGRLESGEKLYDGLIREGKEELNLDLIPIQIIDAYSFKRDEEDLLLLSIFCNYEGRLVKSDEHEELRWVKIEEVKDFFAFEDQKTSVDRLISYLNLIKE